MLEWFSVNVLDRDGDVVATIRKQIYLRIKPRAAAQSVPEPVPSQE